MSILIVTGIEGARNCAAVVQAQLGMEVEVAEGRKAALAALRRHEFSAVVVDETLVQAAHQRGVAVHVWTIEEESEMEELCDLGVDGIITDRPSALVGVLDRLGRSWTPGA